MNVYDRVYLYTYGTYTKRVKIFPDTPRGLKRARKWQRAVDRRRARILHRCGAYWDTVTSS